MNVIRTLRYRLGMSQSALAKKAGITQPDLSEMEKLPPYGYLDKYQRLGAVLGVPMEAILKNKFTAIPEAFFDELPELEYRPMPTADDAIMGREGEELIFQREQERLKERWPALAKLVLPFFKMKGEYPGYDILSFDDFGEPLLIEVKTSTSDNNNFFFTQHELDRAAEYRERGEQYCIVYISAWGSERQRVADIPYDELLRSHQIYPWTYICRPVVEKEPKTTISGLAKFRNLRGLRQAEVAEELGVNQHMLSLYENGHRRPSVEIYMKASELYDTTVDELMVDYEVAGEETVE